MQLRLLMTWEFLDINLMIPLAKSKLWSNLAKCSERAPGELGCVGIEKCFGFWFWDIFFFFSPLKVLFCFREANQESCSCVLWQGWLKHSWKVSSAKKLSGLFSLQDPASVQCSPELMMAKSWQGRDFGLCDFHCLKLLKWSSWGLLPAKCYYDGINVKIGTSGLCVMMQQVNEEKPVVV